MYQPAILKVYADTPPELIITEAYIDDISRSEKWGVSIDVFEYVEIYNTTNENIEFADNYSLKYIRTKVGTSTTGTYDLPLFDDESSVVVPAQGSVILWIYNDSKLTAGKPSITDFREAFDLDESVDIYKVNSSTPNGIYNGYITDFQILASDDNVVCEASFTPDTTNSDGNSVEFCMPASGNNSMLLYMQNVTPTPGIVSPEQYEIAQPVETPDLLITEAFTNDIDRPQWVPEGIDTFDPFEDVRNL